MSGTARCYQCEGMVESRDEVVLHKSCADYLRSNVIHPPKRCAAVNSAKWRCDRDEDHSGPHTNWADNLSAGCVYWAER